MSYEVTRSPQGQPELALSGEPPYCHALEAAPPQRESALDRRRWLIMAFAAWSVTDIRAIQIALDVTRHFNGKIQTGIRPFDDPIEFSSWCPSLEGDISGQGWVVLEEGAERFVRGGPLSMDELVRAIQAALPG